jgi:hypothetical protein
MNDFWAKALSNPAGNTATGATTHRVPTPSARTWTPGGLPPAYSPAAPLTNPKAASSFSTARCPECASGNYKSGGNTMSRCYDCGYNPRFGIQSGAAAMPSGSGSPALPARQVSTTNNYQPGTVIGHING